MSRKMQHLIAYVLCVAMIFTTCIPTVTLAEDVAIVPTEDVSIATETPVSAETPVVEEPTAEPVVEEPTAEPAAEEPTAEPVVEEPTAEPVVEEPTAEPVVEEPTAEPVVEEPTAEPVVEEPTAEPTAEPTEEPTAEPEVEEPTVDYAKSVAENEAFTVGYAKVNGSVEVTADVEGQNVIATLASGSVVYVAERPESGAADELVKIGFYAEEAGVMEGYAAAKALKPLDEASVAALQGEEKYHGHALPAAKVTLPVMDVPVDNDPTADADTVELPAANATQNVNSVATTDTTLAAPVVTVDKTEAWIDEFFTFTLYAPNAEKYEVKENVYGEQFESELDVTPDNTWHFSYGGSGVAILSFRAYVNGQWTPYSEPITLTIKSLGELDEPIVTIPETITTKQDLLVSWTPVENAESYEVVLDDINEEIIASATVTETSTTFKYGSDILLKPGQYRIVVYTNPKAKWEMSSSDMVSFTVTEPDNDPNVTVSDVTVTGEQLSGKEMTASATVTGGSGLYAYNYWLFDSTGTIVDRKENTYDTSWTFTAPAEGVYLMRVYATDFASDAHADSAWFYVQGNDLVVSDVTVTGEMLTGQQLTASATVTGGSGLYAYNYWLFDSTGTIVDRKENTYDTSWTFTAPAEGVYLMRVYATDFASDAHADSAWFYVQGNDLVVSDVTVTGEMLTGQQLTASATVTGGSGPYAYNYWLFDSTGTIVDRKENTFDTSWTFNAPAEGVYLMRIYATDFASDAHADSAWFYVQGNNVAVSDVTVTGEMLTGQQLTTSATVTGGTGFYTYHYWLIDSTGATVDCKENTTEPSWTFTVPAEGMYLTRIYVTDFTTEADATSEWFYVASQPEGVIGLDTPRTYKLYPGDEKILAFTAPADGTYYFISNNCGMVPKASLYADAEKTEWLECEDNSTDEYFLISRALQAGETVYLRFYIKYLEYDWSNITVTVKSSEPLHVIDITLLDGADITYGEKVSIDVLANPVSANMTYSYYLIRLIRDEEEYGDVVLSKLNATENTWTFNAPTIAGDYQIKVVVSNGSETAEASISFGIGAFAIDQIGYDTSGETGELNKIYVNDNGNHTDVVYSYFLLDAQGNTVASNLNSTSDHWMLTEPVAAGVYTAKVVASYNGYTAEKTATVRSGDLVEYFNVSQPTEGTVYVYMNVASHVKTWDGNFQANYWLLDESGAVVAETLNTTMTSFMFPAPTVGGYYTVRATLTYKGETRTYEKTSYFAPLKTIQLDQTLTIINDTALYNSKETKFFFEAPEDGTYYIRANGDVSLNFSGDGRSVEAGVADVCICYEMSAGESVFFAIKACGYGTYTVTVQKAEPVYIDDSLYIEGGVNNTASVTVFASGALAYNYYLLDASGKVVLSNTNTTEETWNFTAPSNGMYQVHVEATNFVETVERYSNWWTSYTPVEVKLNTPLQTYGSAVEVVFKAQKAGYYQLEAMPLDGSTELFWEFGNELSWDDVYFLEAGEDGVWYIKSILPTGMELTVVEPGAGEGNSDLWLYGTVHSTNIGGYPLNVQITKTCNAAGEDITPMLRYELLRNNDEVVLASDWTYERSYTFTLPENRDEYHVRVYATTDGVSFMYSEWYVGWTCAPGSLIGMTEGVPATTSTAGQVLVFQTPAAGEYRITHSGNADAWIKHSQNFNEKLYIWGNTEWKLELEKDEWVYITMPDDGGIEHSVTISRCNRISDVWMNGNDVALTGKPANIYVSTEGIAWECGKYLNWTLQLYTKAGQLVDTKLYSGSTNFDFNWTMPQQSGEYFVRVIMNDGITTEYLDSLIFTVYDTAAVTMDVPVTRTKDDYKVYKFVAPASGMYKFSVVDGYASFYDRELLWTESEFAYESEEANGWVWNESKCMTKGEVLYILVNAYDDTVTLSVSGGNGTMTTGDFLYAYNDDNTGVVITEYMGTEANVTVPASVDDLPVVAIGDSAFEGNRTMVSVELPETVQSIGVRAFANCTNLTTMN